MRKSLLFTALLLRTSIASADDWSADFAAAASRAEAALDAGDRAQAAAALARMRVPDGWPAEGRVQMYDKRADIEDALGDHARSEADYRAALALKPRDFYTLCRLVQTLRDRGRFTDSLKAAQILVTVKSGIIPANRVEKWLQRGETFMRLGRYNEARADIQTALDDRPDDPPSLELMIQILLWQRKAKDALAYADRMVAASPAGPKRARAYVQRAHVREALGDAAGANADAKRAVAEAPEDPFALEARIQRLSESGRNDQALNLINLALKVGRAVPAAQRAALLQRRARIRQDLGDKTGAEEDYRAALTVQSDAILPLRGLIELLLESGRAPQAQAFAVRLASATAEAVPSTRDESLELIRRVQSATKDTKAQAAPSPAQSAAARLERAGLRAAQSDWAGAVSDHAEAERLDPGVHRRNPSAGLGWAFAAAKIRRADGWEILSRLRASSATAAAEGLWGGAEAESRWTAGDDAGARVAMAAALAADPVAACRGPLLEDRAQAAAAYFDACVARFPHDAALLTDRGVERWSSGRTVQAESDFRAALAARPGYLPAAISLASALSRSDRRQDAVAALRTALAAAQSDPASVRTAEELLAQLTSDPKPDAGRR